MGDLDRVQRQSAAPLHPDGAAAAFIAATVTKLETSEAQFACIAQKEKAIHVTAGESRTDLTLDMQNDSLAHFQSVEKSNLLRAD